MKEGTLTASTSADVPATLAAVVSMSTQVLIQRALADELVLYVGAGISVATGLPLGDALASRLAERLVAMGHVVPGDAENDLLNLAAFAETEPGGIELLQQLSLEVAAFTEAEPTFEHLALALLILEGAVTVVTSNWDTCIERAVPRSQISSIVTDEDRLLYSGARLYKVHGCAHRPSTLLISDTQLANPQAWASADVAAALGHATVVFLGIGDVAPYVQIRLKFLLSKIGNNNNIRVVGRSVRTGWGASKWATLLPDLADSQKVERSASSFMDELLRGWVGAGLGNCGLTAMGLGQRVANVYASLFSELARYEAARVLLWLRASRMAGAGTRSIQSPEILEAILGLAVFADGASVTLPTAGAAVAVESKRVELLLGDGQMAGPAAADEARSRVARGRALGAIGPDETAVVLCSGVVGPVSPSTAASLNDDIIARSFTGDLIDGPSAGPTVVVKASLLIDEAATS